MPNSSPGMQSWQIFHFARKHLSRSILYSIFGKKSARAVDYWCEDPKYTAKVEGAYDPIQGVKSLLETLDDQGHCGVVRAAIGYLSSNTSVSCDYEQKIVEPLSSLTAEILADYRAVAEMQRAIENKCAVVDVEYLLNEAVAELERTMVKYRQEIDKEEAA